MVQGNDSVAGGTGKDALMGGDGIDQLLGEAGFDQLLADVLPWPDLLGEVNQVLAA